MRDSRVLPRTSLVPARRLACIFVGLALCTAAVAGSGQAPKSFSLPVAPVGAVAKVTLPALDVTRLLAEDVADQGRDVPYRVGFPREVGLSPTSSGTWEELPDGGRVWRLRVQSPGSPWLSLVFENFDPPEGAELFVYDEAGSWVAGPFARKGRQDLRVLATPVVPGDTCVVELDLPCGADSAPLLATVVTGYKDFPLAKGSSGDCEVDVNCPLGIPWQDEKRAVALIYFLGYICTGQLLNDVPQDCHNYFLTAHHCISKQGQASATIFYWNYEAPTCGGGDGSLSQYQTGSTLLVTKANSDFTLLQLNAKPDSAYHVYYAGWTNSAAAATQATGIHHPAGDVKKISFVYTPLVDGSYYGATHWRVTKWDVGVTEGGSSGSGLWNQDHLLVGQLHGGASACGNSPDRLWDEYGKFTASWFQDGQASKKLRKALDPQGTGATSVPGKDSTTCP